MTEKRDTPFSSIKLFETKNFSQKNSRILLRKFSALWDIKISTEKRDKPPLFQIFFRYQKISGKQKGSFTKLFVSVLWDKKFRQNRDAPPPSYAWKFSIKEFFWNTKVFSNEIFRYSETKTSTENRDTPPSPYQNFFDTRNYCNSKGFPYGNFRHCETKNFERKVVHRIQKSVVELMFVETFRKLDFKQ